MSARTVNRIRDGILSLGSLATVGGGMWAINDRFRDSVASAATDRSLAFIPTINLRMANVNHVINDTLGVSIADHMPLVFFACASFVLFVVMVRS